MCKNHTIVAQYTVCVPRNNYRNNFVSCLLWWVMLLLQFVDYYTDTVTKRHLMQKFKILLTQVNNYYCTNGHRVDGRSSPLIKVFTCTQGTFFSSFFGEMYHYCEIEYFIHVMFFVYLSANGGMIHIDYKVVCIC